MSKIRYFVEEYGLRVECSVERMRDLLDLSNKHFIREFPNNTELFTFQSGAKLFREKKRFMIVTYSTEHTDGLAAIEELRKLDYVRTANAHYEKQQRMNYGKVLYKLHIEEKQVK